MLCHIVNAGTEGMYCLWALAQYLLNSITTNQSETFNYVLKKLNNWTECPVYSMVGPTDAFLAGRVSCHWSPSWPMQTRQLRVMPWPTAAWHQHAGPPSCNRSTEHCGQHTIQSVIVGHRLVAAAVDTNAASRQRKRVDTIPTTIHFLGSTETTLDGSPSTHLTSTEHASQVIQQDKISLNTRLAVFTIIGKTESRVVKLFPAESCSCLAKGSCYHMLAARMAVGLRQENSCWPLNLTQLRRNKRKNKTTHVARSDHKLTMWMSLQPVTPIQMSP